MLCLRVLLFLGVFRAVVAENDFLVWPKFRHDGANTGFFPASSAQVNTVLFETKIGTRAQSSPSYRDGTVYVGSDTGVVAANRWTGEVIWRTYAPRVGFSSPLVLARQWLPGRAGHVVVVVGLDGQLHALDSGAAGAPLWATPVGGVSASPAASRASLTPSDAAAARLFVPGSAPSQGRPGAVRPGLWAIAALTGASHPLSLPPPSPTLSPKHTLTHTRYIRRFGRAPRVVFRPPVRPRRRPVGC